ARLAAERRALQDQGVEPLRGAVDGRAQPAGARADDEQVDLFARRELAADAERAQHVAAAGRLEPRAARQPDDRKLLGRHAFDQRGGGRLVGVAPDMGQAVAAHELDHRPGGLGRARADDLQAESVALLERVAAAHERGGDDVAELLVVEEQATQLVAVDGDVAQALGDHRGHVDGLAGEQVQLAEEPVRAVADDLLALRVEDRRLAREDRDERIRPVADAVQNVADLGGPLLAVRPQQLELRVRQPARDVERHRHAAAAASTPSSARGSCWGSRRTWVNSSPPWMAAMVTSASDSTEASLRSRPPSCMRVKPAMRGSSQRSKPETSAARV